MISLVVLRCTATLLLPAIDDPSELPKVVHIATWKTTAPITPVRDDAKRPGPRLRQSPLRPTQTLPPSVILQRTMHILSGLLLVSGIQLARAHGGHSDGERIAGETIQQYAQRHVSD